MTNRTATGILLDLQVATAKADVEIKKATVELLKAQMRLADAQAKACARPIEWLGLTNPPYQTQTPPPPQVTGFPVSQSTQSGPEATRRPIYGIN